MSKTLVDARERIAAITSDLLETPDEASFKSVGMTYAGIQQRWLVVYTPESHHRATESVNKQVQKQTICLCRRGTKIIEYL